MCAKLDWHCEQVRFYTGVPDERDPGWHYFWKQKRLTMERQGVKVTTTKLRYRKETIHLNGGDSFTKDVAREKGIDVRIALDMVAAAYNKSCEAMVLFSQDQDLAEAIKEVKRVGRNDNREIAIACAFPMSESCRNRNGVRGAKELFIDWKVYQKCIDPKQYTRP